MVTKLNGRLASLGAGDMYYAVHNEEADGPLVVTVHGFACGMLSFDYLSSYLADRGHAVLQYDAFGVGGHSDSPKTSYSMEAFVANIDELLTAAGLADRRLMLVGYSMGCGIAASYAAAHPDRVDGVVLLDPVHGQIEFTGRVIRSPFGLLIGKILARFKGSQLLVDHLKKEYQHPEWPWVKQMIDEQFTLIHWTGKAKPNLVNAAITTVREFPFPDLVDAYVALGGCNPSIPTKIVWGKLSKYYPKRKEVEQALPSADVEVIDDAGHMLFVEKRDEVNTAVSAFLA
jgi:pimeloyl-ACP methyl ester carboxylesterase